LRVRRRGPADGRLDFPSACAQDYPDDAACLAQIMQIQYGGDETDCQVCQRKTRFHPMNKRRAYACQVCGHHIYPCAGTIFHKSSTKLSIWFFAMYLMTSTRHGVAAKEIERQTGVTYKTAWRICHELRKLMAQADYKGPLSGHVEIDETYVGGEPIIGENIVPGTTISTDEHVSYTDLYRDFNHGTVNHGRKEYVSGIHHVNTLESHWSHFKRSVKGTHIHISGKHMWKYVAEFSYRRNMRHSHWAMFDLLVRAFGLPRLKDA
jgi:transposase